ncbi:cell division protein ZapA [endosymbiont 'TC1' of Trimyema compressum]|uniref:cell division protein ZapA n=1 Tax=endosymbiont 'TC1' of Trimyema compressum TaxID=243899 RepID=UPI0013923BAC|nr:cell division protein ZapA [endosymbiont 'TC1' of Trimyema compressum]
MEFTNKKNHVVSVTIFNRPYAIKTDEKTDYIDNLAKELDQLLHRASKKVLHQKLK